MAAKSWRKKYSDLSGSSVICYCEPAKVVGSDHSEQQIAFWSTTPIFTLKILRKNKHNQSFYVYWRYTYFGSNKDAFGIRVRRFANFMCDKKESKVSFYDMNTRSCKEQKAFLSTSPIFESRFCRKIGQNWSVYVS